MESAHARWLDETASDTSLRVINHPVPDPPSDICKLLNGINCEEAIHLIKVLQSTMFIDNKNITKMVREQDEMSEIVRVLAAGLAQKLTGS